MKDELGADGGYVAAGYHMLVPADMVEGLEKNIATQQACGVATGFMSEAEITERLPWLNPDGIAAVTWEPDGGIRRSGALDRGLCRCVRAGGR